HQEQGYDQGSLSSVHFDSSPPALINIRLSVEPLVLDTVGCSARDVRNGSSGCGVLCEARHIKRPNAISVVSSNSVTRVKRGKTQIEQENSVASVCGDCVARTQMQAGMTNEFNSVPISADRGPGKRNEGVFGNFNSSQTAIADCCSERFEGRAAVDYNAGGI